VNFFSNFIDLQNLKIFAVWKKGINRKATKISLMIIHRRTDPLNKLLPQGHFTQWNFLHFTFSGQVTLVIPNLNHMK